MEVHNGDVVPVLLDSLTDDPNLQCRADIDEDGIIQMKEAFESGESFPPIKAIYDPEEKKFYRTDGHRRCKAARLANKKSLPCVVKHGTYRDAVLESLSANQEHDKCGKSRSRQDKRNAVSKLLNDEEWCRWSDSSIAERLGVSAPFVAAIRRELQEVEGSVAAQTKDLPRQGKDGKVRRQPREEANPFEAEPDEPETEEVSESVVEDVVNRIADTFVSGGVSFDVDEIEKSKPRKNGAEKVDFNDKAIHEHFKQLTRLFDDRLSVVGGNARFHREAQRALGEAYSAFKTWEAV